MKTNLNQLRRRAEELLAAVPREIALMPVADVEKLVQELQVHQVELEMQNDELRRTQQELIAARDRYASLYDFAPVALLTLDVQWEIVEVNRSAGELLGRSREELLQKRFTRFLPPDAQDVFYQFSHQVFGGDKRQSVELILVNAQGKRRVVQVEAVRHQSGAQMLGRFSLSDITERIQADAALAAREAQLYSFVQQAPVAIAMFDRKMDYLAVSERWMDDFGHGRRNFFGLNHYEIHPDLPNRWKEIHRQAQAGETLAKDEDLWVQPDGRQIWLRWVVRPWLDIHGKIGGIVMMVEDITARKHAEEARRESERLLQTVMDLVPHFIFVKDRHSRHLLVNRACAAAHGLTPEQMVGKRDYDVLSDRAQAKAFRKADQEVIASGKQKFIAVEYLTDGTGQTRILQTFKIPFVMPSRSEPVLMGVAVDITDLKLAEDALRTSERNLRTLSRALEQSPSSVLITSTSGEIEYVNPHFTETTGYSLQDVLGKTPSILKSGQQTPEFYQELWATITAGRDWRGKFCNRKKNGELFWEFAVIAPIHDEHGAITHFVALKEDITERRRLEAELVEVADREQQRIGHDLHDGLGQQLTALDIKCFLLADDLAADRRAENWQALKKQAQQISLELRECIRVTRTIAQGLAPVALKTRGLMGALEQLAQRSRVPGKIECRFVCRRPVTIKNPQVEKHLYRIAQEAMNNALKHARTRHIRLSLAQTRGTLRLQIKDDGRGLPKRKTSRSGMGVDVMHHRAHLIGATLKIESKPGKGVSVTCTLPLPK